MTPSRPSVAGRFLIESIVIVASILAAFALDRWWDERRERQEERATLEALETDFRAARERILFYRHLQARILHSVGAVGDSMGVAWNGGRRAITVADTALGMAYISPTTSVTLGTLDGVVASGRLGIFRNPRLRSALASWGSNLAELAEEEEDARDLVHGDMDRVLRARMATQGLWNTGGGLLVGSLDPTELSGGRRLPVDTEVLGVFQLRRNLLIRALDEFDPLLEEVDQILALIGESLGAAS